MSSQCISPAASIIANGTFERLLSWMQLNVAQQVSLLGEGSSTLVTLERSLTCEHSDGQRIWGANHTGNGPQQILVLHCYEHCLAVVFSPVWLRLCTISTLGPMQIIPHTSHWSFPLGSLIGPGEAEFGQAISLYMLDLSLPAPANSAVPSSMGSPWSLFRSSTLTASLFSGCGAPDDSSSLHNSTLMEFALYREEQGKKFIFTYLCNNKKVFYTNHIVTM